MSISLAIYAIALFAPVLVVMGDVQAATRRRWAVQAVARVAAAETLKAAPMAAGSAFQMWLKEMAVKVKAARRAGQRATLD